MKLTNKQLEELYFGNSVEVEGHSLAIVEEGGWSVEHKLMSKEIIFQSLVDYRTYRSYVYKSNDRYNMYMSEIDGDDSKADVEEIIKVVTTAWDRVKNENTV